MTTFFLVWRDGGYPPRFRHETKAKAVAEAERLAREKPGETFYVLQALTVTRIEPEPSITTQLDDGITTVLASTGPLDEKC